MKLDEAVTYYGHNYSKMARALGLDKNTLWLWKKKDTIPFHFQCQLEVITDGALKADRNDP